MKVIERCYNDCKYGENVTRLQQKQQSTMYTTHVHLHLGVSATIILTSVENNAAVTLVAVRMK